MSCTRLQAAVIQQTSAAGIELECGARFATLSKMSRRAFPARHVAGVGISDSDILRRIFHSNQVPRTGSTCYYSNRKCDRLIDKHRRNGSGNAQARLHAGAARHCRDAPYISLWYKTNVAAAAGAHRLRPSAGRVFHYEASTAGN